MKQTLRYTILALSACLLLVSRAAAADPVTLYLNGGSGTHEYSSLYNAFKAINTEKLTDVIIEVSANSTEDKQMPPTENVNIVIRNNSGERHAINFTYTKGYRNFPVTDGTTLTIGGGNAVIIIRGTSSNNNGAAYVDDAPTLFKVTTTDSGKSKSKLVIEKNAEICYGENVIWVCNGCEVVQNDGVLHSGTRSIVNVTSGKFTMNGGYIVGHYVTGGDTVPNSTKVSTGENRLLDITDVAQYFESNKSNQYVIRNYLQSVYKQWGIDWSSSNHACPVFVYKGSEFNMTGGTICGFSASEYITGYRFKMRLDNGDDDSAFTKSNLTGGTIHVYDGKASMSGGQVYAVNRTGSGSLFYITSEEFDTSSTSEVYTHSTFEMTGGRLAYGSVQPSNDGGGSAVRIEKGSTMDFSGGRIDHCVCIRAKNDAGTMRNSSGAIRLVSAQLNISGTAEIDNNLSYGQEEAYSGGGVSLVWQSNFGKLKTVLNMSGGNIHDNWSADRGGGISCSDKGNTGSSGLELKLTGGSIHNNKAGVDGGGIYVGSNCDLTISGLNVYSNTSSGDGGGIAIDKNTKSSATGSLTVKSGEIYSNTAGDNGGGIYVSSGSVDLKSDAKIRDNKATNSGGGIAVNNGVLTVSGGTVKKDTATVNGGGIYVYGEAGKLVMSAGSVTDNAASKLGGGIYVSGKAGNTAVDLSGSADISSNTAVTDGGGLYVEAGDVVVSGGSISSNTASGNGGGLYCSGGTVNLTTSGSVETLSYGKIKSNYACNGGAIYLTSGAEVNLTDAVITGNHANGSGDGNGLGGGIYVGDGTSETDKASFTYTDSTKLGLYLNVADVAGDDIYANGNSTSVTVPDPVGKTLTEYSVQATGWFADYKSDVSLPSGIFASDENTGRYSSTSTKNSIPTSRYTDNSLTVNNSLFCISLGFQSCKLTITKSGLKEGESAVYTVTNKAKVRRTMLTGTADAGTDVSVTLGMLDAGDWTVTEESWSVWKQPTVTSQVVTLTLGNTGEVTFASDKGGSPTGGHSENKSTNFIQ